MPVTEPRRSPFLKEWRRCRMRAEQNCSPEAQSRRRRSEYWGSLKFGHLNLPLESAGARSILWVMHTLASKGWMVKVATAGHSGGAPVEQFYAAGYYRMNDAEQAVQRRLMVSGALDEPIMAVRELSASEIQELKLLELEVRRYV
jgi:hypothetical protein